MTPARGLPPLWQAAALAVLVAVTLTAPHFTGHDDGRRSGAASERALAAAPLEAGQRPPAACPLCLAGGSVRDAVPRPPTLVAASAGPVAALAPRVGAPAPRDPRSEPAAPRAPPVG